MVAWQGGGTQLARGFAVLRLHTNQLHLWAGEGAPHAYRCALDPAVLLCRALRLAPASYRRLELAAAQANAPLHMLATMPPMRPWEVGSGRKRHRGMASSFNSAVQLAAALQLCAAAESVSVHLSPDERTIVICRQDTADDADVDEAAWTS